MTTYWRWQRRLMRRSLNIRIVFTARRTGRGLMKSGEKSGAVKWKHSHPPDELTIVWWGDYLNNVQCAENALIQFSMKNILIYVQYLHIHLLLTEWCFVYTVLVLWGIWRRVKCWIICIIWNLNFLPLPPDTPHLSTQRSRAVSPE